MSNKVFVSREFNCLPETLFQWLTEADRVVQWFWPNEFKALNATSQAWQGGSYRVELQKTTGEIFWVEGKYTEVLPYSKIVYEYRYVGLPGAQHSSVVQMIITALDDSRSKLNLTQEFGSGVQVSPNREKAWEAMLHQLASCTSHPS